MAKKQVSKNVARLNSDIQRELVDVIDKLRDPRLKSGLVTITRVETTSDLNVCKVYVSVMGDEAAKNDVMKALDAAKGHIRSEISSRMHIRKAPEFNFIEDDNAEYADHINKLLKEIDPK